MNRLVLAAACVLVCFVGGCSVVDSADYLTLVHLEDGFHVVEKGGWHTRSREPSFGQYKPPLYEFVMGTTNEVVVYPVLADRMSWVGPAFIPIVPMTDKALYPPHETNILKLVHSGGLGDVIVEKIDGAAVTPSSVQETEIFRGTILSVRLEGGVVRDGRLEVELSCWGEKKTLKFEEKKYRHFIPFCIPL